MVTLKNYMNDGAHPSARAVLALLSWFEVEESWDSERKEYLAEVAVNRWHNGREQGYVLYYVANIMVDSSILLFLSIETLIVFMLSSGNN